MSDDEMTAAEEMLASHISECQHCSDAKIATSEDNSFFEIGNFCLIGKALAQPVANRQKRIEMEKVKYGYR